MEYFTRITTAGLAVMAEALAISSTVEITEMAFGDANHQHYEPSVDQTQLVNEQYRIAINSIMPDEYNPNWLLVEAILPPSIGNFYIQEVGLYAGSTLIAVANYPRTYKPLITDGVTREMIIKLIIQIDNADVVNLIVDPNISLATKQYVHDQISNITYQGIKPFNTHAELLAYDDTPPALAKDQFIARVNFDDDKSKNGDYAWDGNSWEKSLYDNEINFFKNTLVEIETIEKLVSLTDSDGFEFSNISIKDGSVELDLNGFNFSQNAAASFELVDSEGFSFSLDSFISKQISYESSETEGLSFTDSEGFNYQLATESEAAASFSEEVVINTLESYALSESNAAKDFIDPPISKLKKGINIFIGYGQSLAIGDEAMTVVSRTPNTSLGNLMLGNAVRGTYYSRTSNATFSPVGGANVYQPLREKWQSGSTVSTSEIAGTNYGETIMTGFLDTLKTLHNRSKNVTNDADVVLAGSVTGAVGTDIATLLKGAGTGYYERLYTCIEGHIAAATAAGYTDINFAGVLWLQGETVVAGTTRAAYLAMLKTLKNSINADVKALLPNNADIGFFTYQTGGVYINNAEGNSMPISNALLDLSNEADSFLLAPIANYPQAVSNKAHKSANGYRWWGCAAAHNVWKIYNNVNQKPFSIVKAVYHDDTVYVSFNTPNPPITIKPYYVVGTETIAPDLGFSLIDSLGTLSGGALTIDIVASNTVRIKANRTLGTDVRINLGDYLHGGQHNIADSSPQLSIFKFEYFGDGGQTTHENITSLVNKKYQLYNQAVIQQIAASPVN